MPRVSARKKSIVKTVDCLLQLMMRLFNKDNFLKVYWHRLIGEALSRELRNNGVEGKEEIFFRHYILCYVQVFSASEIRSSFEKKFYESINKTGVSVDVCYEDYNKVKEFEKKFEVGFVVACLKISMERFGIDESIVSKIAFNLMENEEIIPFLSHKNLLMDLSINDYLVRNPFCVLDFISSASAEGGLSYNRVRGRGRYLDNEEILVLSLYREFNNSVRSALKQKYSFFCREEDVVKTYFSGKGGEIKKSKIEFDVEKMRIETYREMAHEIIDSSSDGNFEVALLPVKSVDENSWEVFDLLVDYSLRGCKFFYFDGYKNGVRFDKKLSIVGSFYVYFAKFFVFGDSADWKISSKEEGSFNEGRSISEFVSSRYLGSKFDIIVSPKVLCRTYSELGEDECCRVFLKWKQSIDNEGIFFSEGWLPLQVFSGSFEYMNG